MIHQNFFFNFALATNLASYHKTSGLTKLKSQLWQRKKDFSIWEIILIQYLFIKIVISLHFCEKNF